MLIPLLSLGPPFGNPSINAHARSCRATALWFTGPHSHLLGHPLLSPARCFLNECIVRSFLPPVGDRYWHHRDFTSPFLAEALKSSVKSLRESALKHWFGAPPKTTTFLRPLPNSEQNWDPPTPWQTMLGGQVHKPSRGSLSLLRVSLRVTSFFPVSLRSNWHA